MKTCNRCKVELLGTQFSKDAHKHDGLSTICKSCKSEYRKKYYADNAADARNYSRQWYRNNPDKAKKAAKLWRAQNGDKIRRMKRKNHAKNYHSNINYRLSHIMRANFRAVLEDIKSPKNSGTFSSLGYTPEQLRIRIEMNFCDGMVWENYGEWEIDHKVPISRMLARGEKRPEVINALSNLQPMWKRDNRIKGNRWIGDNRQNRATA
jgi:hypothetical protein